MNQASGTKPSLKILIDGKQVKKLLATIAKGGIEKSHPHAVQWAQKIFYQQPFGEKRVYLSPQEASKIFGS